MGDEANASDLFISDVDDASVHLDDGQTDKMTPEERLQIITANLDGFFLIVMGCIVFLMQCGFAFLEAGSVR